MKAIVIVTALTLLSTAISATAQEVPLCYMRTKDGSLLNLEKLCGRQDIPAQPLSTEEQQFLAEVRRSMQGSFGAQAALNPSAAINQAKRICGELEAGTFSGYQQSQAETNATYGDPTTQFISSSQSRAIQTVAPKYFCPGFDG